MLPPMSTQLRVGFEDNLEASRELWTVQTAGAGPRGSLPLTGEMLLEWSSGDLFGLTQNAGMGWDPRELTRPQFLMLSTQGGVRAPDGHPIALGYHTGHWEVGLLMQAAAAELKRLECLPFAAFVSDPCDGRTQGTTGMMDSLPYRNDAAQIFRRLIRSLPTRHGVLGVATCDKGLPAMMMALAAMRDLPCVLVPGGVTLPPTTGEDAGKVQTIGARFAHGQITLEQAAEIACRACASPGGGCQFLGTAATSQVVAEALGLAVPHSALAPSGQPIWTDAARRSAVAVLRQMALGLTVRDDVIMAPSAAKQKGLTSTVSFIGGNLAPQGAIVKSTAIDRATIGPDGVYRHTGPARVFTSERAAIAAVKSRGEDRLKPGEVVALVGRGPLGAGMEEVYQVTAALKYLDFSRTVALITDARFSGVSTGPCVGHVPPEALPGG